MPTRAFVAKQPAPTEPELARTLGKSYALWQAIRTALGPLVNEPVLEWKYYTTGWTLKFLHKARNLFFLIPCRHTFLIAFVFGDRAVDAVEASRLPKAVIASLVKAKRYAEGRGIRIEVKQARDVEVVRGLARIKLEN
jgi:hypothetical protein